MTKAAAKTGSGPMTMVAIEQHFPQKQRIIEDDLAKQMLPFGERAYVWLMQPTWARDWMVRMTEKTLPGLWGGMMCRKRYIDEKVSEAANQIDTVVNLGAGFDTRAYRLSALADLPVWEVDQSMNIEPKRALLRKLFGEVPAHVRLVPIDFDREALDDVLTTHGYRTAMRTFFIWEAVTQYLSESGIRATFDFLVRAVPGSRLAFTYVRQDFLDGQALYGQEALYKKYIVQEKLWLFGMDPADVVAFLNGYGWRVIEHLSYEDLAEGYIKPTGRPLAATPIERIVYAEKL